MDRKKIKKYTLEFLKKQRVVFLATASRQGDPQVAMVYCGVDDDFTFNFVTTARSRKFQNIKNNPHVAIAVGSADGMITVQCGGHAEIIDYKNTELIKGGKTIIKVMTQAGLKNTPEWPVLLSFPPGELGVFKVRPEWMALLDLNYKKDPEIYAHNYQVVLP